MYKSTADVFGFIGGLITSMGGIPQIIKIINTKKADDLSWGMLLLWLSGMSMTTIYGIMINEKPIYYNSLFSIIETLVIVKLKIKYMNEITYDLVV